MGSVHGWVGKPGPAPLMAQRQEFAALIARGVSNAEACRLVGVNRRTLFAVPLQSAMHWLLYR